jgi:hypothetical protein
MGKQLVSFITYGCEPSAPFSKLGRNPHRIGDRIVIVEILLKVALNTKNQIKSNQSKRLRAFRGRDSMVFGFTTT